MKVKDLIKLLQEHDPDMNVLIEQGEEDGYMETFNVREKQVPFNDNEDNEEVTTVVVIDY
jgi:hypothetical protein